MPRPLRTLALYTAPPSKWFTACTAHRDSCCRSWYTSRGGGAMAIVAGGGRPSNCSRTVEWWGSRVVPSRSRRRWWERGGSRHGVWAGLMQPGVGTFARAAEGPQRGFRHGSIVRAERGTLTEDTSESFAVKSHSFHKPKPPGCGWLLGGRRAKDTPSRALDGAVADEVAWRRAERVSGTRALSRQTKAQVDCTGSSFVSDAVRCTHPWRVFVVRLRRSFISWRTCNHVTILCLEEWSPPSVPVPAFVQSGTGMVQRVQKILLACQTPLVA